MTTATDLAYFTIPRMSDGACYGLDADGYVTHMDSLAWTCEYASEYARVTRGEVYEVTTTGTIRLVAVMAVVR